MEKYLYHIPSKPKRMRIFDDIKHTLRKVEGLFEVIVLSCLYFHLWKTCYRPMEDFHKYYGNGKYILVGVYALLVFFLFLYCDSFKYGHRKLADVLVSQWISLAIVNFVTYFQLSLIANHMLNVLPMLELMGLDVIFSLLFTYMFTAVYHRFYVPRRMVMVYGSDNALTLKNKMDSRADKYRIEKNISETIGYEKICRELEGCDAVVLNDISAQIRNDLLKYCYENEMRLYIVPKISDIIIKGAEENTLFDIPLFLVKGRGLTLTQSVAKRAMDIVLCSLALIPAAGIMLLVALAIKLEDHGPIFYRQERVTKDGKIFRILKFRSMIVDAEKDGQPIPAVDHDPRITKVGRVIRALRLDELPQILNILKGDMSIVGPRPERVEHVEKYMREIPEFRFRMKVKGGLTGYAQIYGKYNTSAYDKLRLDLMYIENYSLLMDIKMILMTLQIMLHRESTEGFLELNKSEDCDEAAASIENDLPENDLIYPGKYENYEKIQGE